MKEFKPSKYQQEIFNKQVTTNKHILIDATAGSGKSKTLTEIAKMFPYGKRNLFCAFNKSIVNELKTKLPPTVECRGMHSIGWKVIFDNYNGKVKMNETKQIKFILPFFEDKKNKREKWIAVYTTDKLMRLIRVTMTPLNREEIEKLIIRYALYEAEKEHIDVAIKCIKKIHEYNESERNWELELDYTEMIEIPARRNDLRLPQYDNLMIDEFQDMSEMDMIFLSKLVKPNGRRFVAGDFRQLIYGFRGSSSKTFEKFLAEPNTIKLPLSISYRCSKKVVEEARKVYTEIEPWEEAEEGEVKDGQIIDIREGDFVLCRNTRPLIEVFFKLIERGLKCQILGKDMEKGLLSLMTTMDSDEKTIDCYDRLEFLKEKCKKELAAKNIQKPENHPKYLMLSEKIQILELLFSKFEKIGEVESFIEETFEEEEKDAVKLMTIHKSKGMENERVFIIKEFEGKKLIPSPYAVNEEMLIAEKNLEFVSITRAKKELIYLYL